MIGKPRPNPDRSPGDAAKQPSSGALIGMSGVSKATSKARAGFFAAKRPADPAITTVRSAAADAQKSRLPQMAAALSYRTIFGLLPVIIVALVAVKYFASEEHVRMAVEKSLEYSGLSAIAVSPETMADWHEGMMGPPPPPAEDPGEAPAAVLPNDGEGEEGAVAAKPNNGPPAAVDKWITDLIERVNSVSLKAIGLAGAVMLIYAAMAMLVEVERAFNQIYRVPRGRSWIRRIMQYWTLLTLGPLALIATFYVGQQFMSQAQDLAERQGVKLGSGTWTMTAIGYSTTVAISTCFFCIAYLSVPNTKVRLRPALVGALSAALLWEAGKWGFTQYLRHSAGTAQLYGALALLPLFLLWVYFTWLIVLFGLQIAYELQHGRAKTRAQPISDMGPTLVDPAAALVVLSAIARGFESGKSLDAPALTVATSLPEPVIRMVVGRLAERGMLHRLENGSDEAEPSYALARSPSSIRAAEVLELGYELAGSTETDEAIQRLHRAQIDSLGDQTLGSLTGTGVGGAAGGRTAPAENGVSAQRDRLATKEGSRSGPTAATLPEAG